MKIDLIYATPNAAELLIFTKNTRLEMNVAGLYDIMNWQQEKKEKELRYMSETNPGSWEFVDVIFSIQGVTRAFTHQLVRTRNASYAQQSMRVTKQKGFAYTTPSKIAEDKLAEATYADTMHSIQEGYNALLQMDIQPEDARGVLPTNIHTNIVAKYTLRSFAELVRKRSSGRVQAEYSEFITLAIAEVIKVWPWSVHFLADKKSDALADLTRHFKILMEKEIIAGKVMNETISWTMMKKLDLLRD
jgi:flavin-dependent thymidylate synthase